MILQLGKAMLTGGAVTTMREQKKLNREVIVLCGESPHIIGHRVGFFVGLEQRLQMLLLMRVHRAEIYSNAKLVAHRYLCHSSVHALFQREAAADC